MIALTCGFSSSSSSSHANLQRFPCGEWMNEIWPSATASSSWWGAVFQILAKRCKKPLCVVIGAGWTCADQILYGESATVSIYSSAYVPIAYFLAHGDDVEMKWSANKWVGFCGLLSFSLRVLKHFIVTNDKDVYGEEVSDKSMN